MGSKILWAIVGGCIAGVFVRSFFSVGAFTACLAAMLSILSLFILMIDRRYARFSIVTAFACAAFGFGIARMEMGQLRVDPVLMTHVDTRVTLVGTVSDEPDVREKNILVPIEVHQLFMESTSIPVDAKILAQAPPYTLVSYGDTVRVEGTLRESRAFDTAEGRVFDYPKYLAVSGVTFQLTNAHIEIAGENESNFAKASAIALKHLYLAGLVQALPEPHAGLAGGITVGDKRSIGPELSEDFRRVSLVHILVLSGYNITIVITAIARMFSWLPRSVDFGISGVVVLFFVLMTGGAASAMRAGAMALLAMYARVSGRTFLAVRALGVVALAMVLWNPYTLGFDPSFQLSVLATLGLITLTPILTRYLSWITEKFALREIAASTLGTQIAVLPLLLYQNGVLSLVALPANLFALVPIPLAMLLSFIAAIGGLIGGALAPIVGFPAYIILTYVIGVAKFFAALPFAAVTIPPFSIIWMFIIYALMFVGVWWVQKKAELRIARPLPRRSDH
jgi:competence protein ComEC